ncbi:DUF6182 family protein [Streptomyces boninensis]|uniref:DUF6182 family protein n=1 Tax=Streptomyces boninensis TaxID=2039455 RepID=UPI003B224135
MSRPGPAPAVGEAELLAAAVRARAVGRGLGEAPARSGLGEASARSGRGVAPARSGLAEAPASHGLAEASARSGLGEVPTHHGPAEASPGRGSAGAPPSQGSAGAPLSQGSAEAPSSHCLTTAVIVAGIDLRAFIAGAAGFALTTPRDLADGWYRSFTRTVFLAGRPASIAARHPHSYGTANGNLAWHGPSTRGQLRPLSRLLRTFEGPALIAAPPDPVIAAAPGPPSGHTVSLTLATSGISTAEYLVHVHHLIAESTLLGLVRPGDRLLVEHRPTLEAAAFRDALHPTRARTAQARVMPSGTEAGRLRLYGVLLSDRSEGAT